MPVPVYKCKQHVLILNPTTMLETYENKLLATKIGVLKYGKSPLVFFSNPQNRILFRIESLMMIFHNVAIYTGYTQKLFIWYKISLQKRDSNKLISFKFDCWDIVFHRRKNSNYIFFLHERVFHFSVYIVTVTFEK